MGWQAAHSAFELQFWGYENPKVFWLKLQFQHTHKKEVKSQYLSVTDPRTGYVVSQGSSGPPLQLTEGQETEPEGGTHRLLAGWLEWRSLSMMSALSNYFKRSLRKSKAEICGQNPKLGSLSNYLGSGSHTAKCLQLRRAVFSSHRGMEGYCCKVFTLMLSMKWYHIKHFLKHFNLFNAFCAPASFCWKIFLSETPFTWFVWFESIPQSFVRLMGSQYRSF